jgi:hypothetical protein
VRPAVAAGHLLGHLVEPMPPRRLRGAGEVLVDELVPRPDGLEDLRPRVGRHRGDAHLGHHLEDALAAGLDVVAHRLGRVVSSVSALGDEVLDGLEGQVGVDGRGAVAEQQADVVHLAGIAGFDHQTAPWCGSSRG